MQNKILGVIIAIFIILVLSVSGFFAYTYYYNKTHCIGCAPVPKASISNARIDGGLAGLFEITWDSFGVDRVNIDLFNADVTKKNRVIAQGIKNENKYSWTIEDIQAWRSWDGPFTIIISDANNSSIKAQIDSFTASGAYPADNYDETASWTTYTNTDLNFEIRYPAECSLYRDDNTGQQNISCGKTKWTETKIYFGNDNLNTCTQDYGLKYVKKELNGTIFDYVSYQDAAMGGQRASLSSYRVLLNGKCFIISSYVHYSDLTFLEGVTDKKYTEAERKEQDEEIKEKERLVDLIVSTFKFVEPNMNIDQELEINGIKYSFKFIADGVSVIDAQNNLVQKIIIGKDSMDLAIFYFKEYKHSIVSANDDINFDGKKDLSILVGDGYGGVNLFYNFYIFNSQTKKFDEVEKLKDVCNPKVELDKKQILSPCKSGPSYYEQIYQFNGAGYDIINVTQNLDNSIGG